MKDELIALMEAHRLNVKKVAGMLHVSARTVYQWLDGSRRTPAMAVELLTFKLSSPRQRVEIEGCPKVEG